MSDSKEPTSSLTESQAASNRGALLHMDGNIKGAKQAYEEALAADPDNATALNNLGFLYAQEGRLDEAEGLYMRAIEINPNASMARGNLGNVRAMKGDVNGAVQYLREAVAIDAGNVLAWDSLGRVLFKAGRHAEAESAWAEAVGTVGKADPSDISQLYTGLGMAVAAQGRLDEAVRILQEAASLDPESVEAWTQLGVALLLRKDFGSATEALKRALAVDPDASQARRHLGTVYMATGDRGAARREFERAVKLDDSQVGARADLAVLDLAEGKAELALGRLAGIDAKGHEGDRVRFYRGIALDQLGKASEALELLRPLSEQVFGKYAAEARRYLATRRSATEDLGRSEPGA